MEFDVLRGVHNFKLTHDSQGTLDFNAPQAMWAGNLVAASQLWPIEFIGTKTRLSVVDISSRGAGQVLLVIDLVETPAMHRLDPWWNTSPRGFTHLRVLELLGREVLVALDDNGGVHIWKTIDLYQKTSQKWRTLNTGYSAWGVDIYNGMVAVSDNSQRITLFGFAQDQEPGKFELSLVSVHKSEPLGGNIPSVAFVEGYIAYTVVYLDMESGSFGLLNLNLEQEYAIKVQQPGWCVKPIAKADLLRVASPLTLCGSETLPSSNEVSECIDICNVAYHLEEGDRLGFNTRWTTPQTWIIEQQRRLKEWVKHGRRKSFMRTVPIDSLLFISTSAHGSLVSADSGLCLATGHKSFLPPGVDPSDYDSLALSIVEVIPELSLAFAVSRAATVVIVRFTRFGNMYSFRQESVLCDFNDFIIGLSVRPARAHDFDFELQTLEEPRSFDVPDKTLGMCGKWIVRVHGREGQVEAFIVE